MRRRIGGRWRVWAWAGVVAVVAATGAGADAPVWRPRGPEGGEVRALAADPHRPGVLYAGVEGGGVFVSRDGGGSWTAASRGILAARVNDLVADPVVPGVLYAATGDGVYKTTDGGASWQAAGRGLPAGGAAGELVLHPHDPAILFVTVPLGFSGVWQVFRSTDGGASWADVSGGIHFGPALAIAPASPPIVYAAGTVGVYASADGGESWVQGRRGLPLGRAPVEILVDPASPQVLYAALGPTLFGDAPVYKSLDGGASWTAAAQGLPSPDFSFWALAADPEAPGTVYAGGPEGLYKTTDGGGRWSAVGGALVELRQVLELAAVPPPPPGDGGTLLFAGVSRRGARGTMAGAVGVLRSTDGGESWQAHRAGLDASFITAVAPHPETAGAAVAGAETLGVVSTVDGGATWQPSNTGLTASWVGPVVRHSVVPETLYVLGGDGPLASRVFESLDGGVSWDPLGEEIGCCLEGLAVDPGPPTTLYVAAGSGRLLRSTGGGDTWEELDGLSCGHVTAVGVLPAPPKRLLAGCARDSGLPVSPPVLIAEIFASDDGGDTWQRLFEAPATSLYGAWSFAFDPHRPGVVYAGLAGFESGAVFRSSDGGDSWEQRGLAGIQVQALGVDPFPPGHLYAGSAKDGIFTSADEGASWRPLSTGLLSAGVRSLGFGPDGLWAATSGGGVHALAREGLAGSCTDTDTALCLDGRFRVTVEWRDRRGRTGPGRAAPLSGRSGAFSFFASSVGADNLELVVKLVDGRAVNGHFWIFYASLSNLGYTLTVTDTATGRLRRYENPPGRLASAGDSRAFIDPGSGTAAAGPPAATGDGAGLALAGGRFRVEVSWQDFRGRRGTGEGVALGDRGGYFWFVRPDNPEVAVKLVDGRAVNGRFWIFIGSLSNVAYEVTVTDLETGQQRVYRNPPGEFGSRADTGSF